MLAAGRYYASQLAARMFVCSPVGRIRDISYVLFTALFKHDGAEAHVKCDVRNFENINPDQVVFLKAIYVWSCQFSVDMAIH